MKHCTSDEALSVYGIIWQKSTVHWRWWCLSGIYGARRLLGNSDHHLYIIFMYHVCVPVEPFHIVCEYANNGFSLLYVKSTNNSNKWTKKKNTAKQQIRMTELWLAFFLFISKIIWCDYCNWKTHISRKPHYNSNFSKWASAVEPIYSIEKLYTIFISAGVLLFLFRVNECVSVLCDTEWAELLAGRLAGWLAPQEWKLNF